MNSDDWWGGARNQSLQGAVTEMIAKKAGFPIKATIIPRAQYKQHLVELFQPGNKFDVARITYASGFIPGYAGRKEILPLDEFLTDSKTASGVDSTWFESLKINGHVYGLPCARPAQKILWFRKDLVERFGINLKDVMTLDDFHEQLKKAGGLDEIMPLSFPKFTDNLQFFFNAFGGYASIHEKDGKHIDGFQTQEIKTALLFIKTLYDEKILEHGLFGNEYETVRQNLATGKAVAGMDYHDQYAFYMHTAQKEGFATDFMPVYALTGPGGAGGTLNEGVTDVWVIAADCKNPQGAFDLINLLAFDEEVIKAAGLGIEGKHYTVENGLAVSTELAASGGAQLSLGSRAPENVTNRQTQITIETYRHVGHFYQVPVWKSQRLADLNLALRAKREETVRAIIFGTKSIEDAYKSYEAYWKSMDGDGILAECDKYRP